MEATMITLIFFLTFWPFHHKPKAPPTPPDLITYELAIINQVTEARSEYPSLDAVYFTSILAAIQQLQEPVNSPTFEQDFDKLEQDIYSLRIAMNRVDEDYVV